jgi:hypothetical protein
MALPVHEHGCAESAIAAHRLLREGVEHVLARVHVVTTRATRKQKPLKSCEGCAAYQAGLQALLVPDARHYRRLARRVFMKGLHDLTEWRTSSSPGATLHFLLVEYNQTVLSEFFPLTLAHRRRAVDRALDRKPHRHARQRAAAARLLDKYGIPCTPFRERHPRMRRWPGKNPEQPLTAQADEGGESGFLPRLGARVHHSSPPP